MVGLHEKKGDKNRDPVRKEKKKVKAYLQPQNSSSKDKASKKETKQGNVCREVSWTSKRESQMRKKTWEGLKRRKMPES